MNNNEFKCIPDHLTIKCKSCILIFGAVFCMQTANAADSWRSFESHNGFSEFAPPSEQTSYDENRSDWRSGSSFKHRELVRYLPVNAKKNPWKAVGTMHYRKTFSGNRPWGNIPDRKPSRVTNMRLHDQRFKNWSHQVDAYYHNNFNRSEPYIDFSRSALPFITNYGFPGSIYNNPLITPVAYPSALYGVPGYGTYPASYYPQYNLPLSFWRW